MNYLKAPIDKIDVVEALAEALDDQVVAGLGFVLAGADFEKEGTLVLQTWPVEGEPSVDFLCRVTRFRPRAAPPEPEVDDQDEDDEEFCARCLAGVDSDEHHGKCVESGHAQDGESAAPEPSGSGKPS
jgi:hypothetical protein